MNHHTERPQIQWTAASSLPDPQPVRTPPYTDSYNRSAAVRYTAWHPDQATWDEADHTWHCVVGRRPGPDQPEHPWPAHLPWWAALPPPVFPALAQAVITHYDSYVAPVAPNGAVEAGHLELFLCPVLAAWSAAPYRGNNSTRTGHESQGTRNTSACGLGPTRRQLCAMLQRFHLPGDRRSTRRYLSNQLTKYLQLGRLWYNVLAATEGSVALSVELCCRAAITNRHLADIHPSLSDDDNQGEGDADSDAAGDDWDAMSTASGVTTALGKFDHVDAHKKWPAHVDDQSAALLLTLDPYQHPVALRNRTLNFSAVGSVWGYCWRSCSLSISASWALGLVILAYVDDFATIAPTATTMAGIISTA